MEYPFKIKKRICIHIYVYRDKYLNKNNDIQNMSVCFCATYFKPITNCNIFNSAIGG